MLHAKESLGSTLWVKSVATVGTFLCLSVAVLSMRYVFTNAVGPEQIMQNLFRVPWLTIHAAGASLALLLGPLQFLKRVRQQRPALHRWVGRIYAAGCMVGGISGLFLAFGAVSGPIATVGFGLLAISWLITTGLAWRAAAQRRFADHRVWMIRSFALTFAAVTLRTYLFTLLVLPIDFVNGYRAISFLCWVPNLVAVEYYLRRSPPMAR